MNEKRFNPKFIGFDGVIGRYDFFLNFFIYIGMITLLYTIPLKVSVFSQIYSLEALLNPAKLYAQTGILLKIWVFLIQAGVCYIGVSNIIRRLNDINGRVIKAANLGISSFYVLTTLFSLYNPIFYVLGWIMILIELVLLFKDGAVTGKYPYDFRKEFNWGAFFGTWLWGLFNRTYKPLWSLLIAWTPWGILYAVYLGLKGNEMAYKSRPMDSIEKFNDSQEAQVLPFVIYKLILLIIIPVIIIFAVSSVVMNTISFSDSAQLEKIEKKLDNVLSAVVSMCFESYTITDDENKFYVLPDYWKQYSLDERLKIFDMAAQIAADEKRKTPKDKFCTKKTERPRTKIYNSINHELLGEYIYEQTSIQEVSSFKDIIKDAMKEMNNYKFYKPTVFK